WWVRIESPEARSEVVSVASKLLHLKERFAPCPPQAVIRASCGTGNFRLEIEIGVSLVSQIALKQHLRLVLRRHSSRLPRPVIGVADSLPRGDDRTHLGGGNRGVPRGPTRLY